MNRAKGFSLVELLVVIVLFSVLSLAIGTAIFAGQKSWTVGSSQALLTSDLRKVLDRMSRELVSGRAGQIQRPAANGVWEPVAIFRVPQDRNGDGSVLDANGNIVEWSDSITYSRGAGNACLRSVTPPGPRAVAQVETLASHMTDLQFRRQAATPDLVEIQATASTLTVFGQVMSRSMGTRVKLRNS